MAPADTAPPAPERRSPARAPRAVAGLIALLTPLIGLASCGDDARSATAAHRLVIQPCQGSLAHRTSAAAVAPDLLVTTAHGFEGASGVEVSDAGGRAVAATVVRLDPAKDIAVLATDRPVADHLDLTPPEEDQPVVILTYGDVEGPRFEPAEIVELVDVTLDGQGRRAALRLDASVSPGDSGSAVLDADGRMVGMVFATARDTEAGWAVSSTEVAAAVAAVERDGRGAALPAC